jgi:hypothetical protein
MIVQIDRYSRIRGFKFRVKDNDEEFRLVTLFDEFAIPNAYHNALSNSQRDENDARQSFAFCTTVCKKNKQMEVRPYAFKTFSVNKIKKITMAELPHWKVKFEAWSNRKKKYLIIVTNCNQLFRISFEDYLKQIIKPPTVLIDNKKYVACESILLSLQRKIKSFK